MIAKTPVCLIVLAWIAGTNAHAEFIGVTWEGNVLSIDESSGSASLIGASGFDRLNSLGVDPSGRLVTGRTDVNINSTESDVLFLEIDAVSGAASLFANTVLPGPQSLRGLTYTSSGELILATRPSESGGSDEALLWALEEPGAAGALIGSHEPGLQGLTTADDGTLYGWHIDLGLVTVDALTAALTDVNGVIDGTADIQSIAFAPDGTLYGARDSLFSIDVTTGEFSPIGAGGFGDVRGLAWVPAPGTLAFFLLGAGFRRRRRRQEAEPCAR